MVVVYQYSGDAGDGGGDDGDAGDGGDDRGGGCYC